MTMGPEPMTKMVLRSVLRGMWVLLRLARGRSLPEAPGRQQRSVATLWPKGRGGGGNGGQGGVLPAVFRICRETRGLESKCALEFHPSRQQSPASPAEG